MGIEDGRAGYRCLQVTQSTLYSVALGEVYIIALFFTSFRTLYIRETLAFKHE